jgi:hypothetical protein
MNLLFNRQTPDLHAWLQCEAHDAHRLPDKRRMLHVVQPGLPPLCQVGRPKRFLMILAAINEHYFISANRLLFRGIVLETFKLHASCNSHNSWHG